MFKATRKGMQFGRVLEKTDEDKAAILELFVEHQNELPLRRNREGVWRTANEED